MDVDTRAVGVRERFDYWCENVCDQFVPLLATPSSRDVQGRIRALELAQTHVRRIASTQHRFVRRASDIRFGGDPQTLNVVFVNKGLTTVEQDGRTALLRPGDFLFYDSGRPFEFRTDGVFDYSILLMPKHRLEITPNRMASVTALPESAAGGMASLVQDLTSLILTQPWSARFGAAVQEHLLNAVALLAHDGHASRAGFVAAARAYVCLHLDDPGLSPSDVAQFCRISVSYLHRLFDGETDTVSAFIREQRLQAARAMLTSPHHRRDSIADIGRACGIHDAARFSRMVHLRYGASPRNLRRRALEHG